MAHIKRTKMPKTWPFPRKKKSQRFVAVPSHLPSEGVSVLFILRDILKIAKTRKEARYMTLNGLVKVNHKIRKDENFPVGVFDVLTLEKEKKNYKLEIVNKKFKLKEVEGSDADRKIVKIIGKKILSSSKVQMNLGDGSNFITKHKFSVGDSVVINTKENKIEKILELGKGAKVEVILGKHAGERGEFLRFEELERGRDFVVKLKKGESVLPYKSILVVE